MSTTPPDESPTGASPPDVEPRAWVVLDVASRVAIIGMAMLAGGLALVERSWLGGRTVWIVLVAGAAALTAARSRARWGLVGTAVLVTVGTGIGLSGMGRATGRGAASRVLARDLPPPAAYAVPMVFLLIAGCCAVLAISWRSTAASASRRDIGRGLAAGLAAIGLAFVTLPIGHAAREFHDRGVEAEALVHAVSGPAERMADEPGPAQPTEPVWEVELREGVLSGSVSPDRLLPRRAAVAAVPGWDVVLVHATDEGTGDPRVPGPSRVLALSASRGSELWRYERVGDLDAVVADPESGRVLLVSADAAIVLDLEDGEELTVRALPDDLWCTGAIGDRFSSSFRGDGVAIGSTAVMRCAGARDVWPEQSVVAMIEVASGTVLATDDGPEDCAYEYSEYEALTSTESPVLVRAAHDPPPGCQGFEVLALAATGEIEPIAEVAPPSGAASALELVDQTDCGGPGIVAAGDTIVLTLYWSTAPDECDEPPAVVDVVALSTGGSVRWRVTGRGDDLGAPVAVTAQGVVVRGGNVWRLLSLGDGTELLRRPAVGGDTSRYSVAVSDGERIYIVDTEVGLVVRRADNLAPLGTWSDASSTVTAAGAYIAAGRLIVPLHELVPQSEDGGYGDRYTVVAYGDGSDPLNEP